MHPCVFIVTDIFSESKKKKKKEDIFSESRDFFFLTMGYMSYLNNKCEYIYIYIYLYFFFLLSHSGLH